MDHEASGDASSALQALGRRADTGVTTAGALLAWQRGAGTSMGAAMWLVVGTT